MNTCAQVFEWLCFRFSREEAWRGAERSCGKSASDVLRHSPTAAPSCVPSGNGGPVAVCHAVADTRCSLPFYHSARWHMYPEAELGASAGGVCAC